MKCPICEREIEGAVFFHLHNYHVKGDLVRFILQLLGVPPEEWYRRKKGW